MVIPLWQARYQSSHQLTAQLGAECAELATHTGTLDPMAEGVLIVLTGEDRFLKGQLEWSKVYEFSILWGITTDSGDQLGLITKLAADHILPHTETDSYTKLVTPLAQVITQFPSQYQQLLPTFSARRIQGQSSFDLAKQQQPITQKSRLVFLTDFEFVSSNHLPVTELLTAHGHAISQVRGEFRQPADIQSWQQQLQPLADKHLLLTHHRVTTTPGTYIRQLVQDLARSVGMPATTYSITRIQNGPFAKNDCLNLGIN